MHQHSPPPIGAPAVSPPPVVPPPRADEFDEETIDLTSEQSRMTATYVVVAGTFLALGFICGKLGLPSSDAPSSYVADHELRSAGRFLDAIAANEPVLIPSRGAITFDFGGEEVISEPAPQVAVSQSLQQRPAEVAAAVPTESKSAEQPREPKIAEPSLPVEEQAPIASQLADARPKAKTVEVKTVSLAPAQNPLAVATKPGRFESIMSLAKPNASVLHTKQDESTCVAMEAHGTALEWADSPAAAYRLAKEKDKLVFLIHVSGNFEIPGFT